MKQRINTWSLIEISCYVAAGAGLFYLVFSKHYLDFVTPKMRGYLLFAGIIFIIWGIADIPGSRRAKYKRRMGHCALVIIPMLLLAAGSQIGGFHEAVNGFHSANEAIEVFADSRDPIITPLNGLREDRQEIQVREEDYLEWITALLKDGKRYEGYTVFLKAMLYQEEGMDMRHEFFLIRKLMSCCAADVMPVGILCHWEGDAGLIESEWVSICAKVKINESGGCYLEVTSIMEDEKPEEEYLYEN